MPTAHIARPNHIHRRANDRWHPVSEKIALFVVFATRGDALCDGGHKHIHVTWCKLSEMFACTPFTRYLEGRVTDRKPELPVVKLVEAIARILVDKPEAVSINEISSGAGTLFRLRVDPTDVGKVIGKQGRTARSVRTILGAISVKLKHRYSLEIIEYTEGAPGSAAGN